MELITREAGPAHFLLKIESFSLLNCCGVGKYETKEFNAGVYKWRLVIYPDGQGTVGPGNYVSVYLAISDTDFLHKDWEVDAVFSIFTFNHISGNYVHTPGMKRRFSPFQTKWGFSNFISKTTLVTPSSGYLIDDSCLFGAEVLVVGDWLATDCLSLKNVGTPHKHVIKISNFSTIGSDWQSEYLSAGGYDWNIVLYQKGYEVKSTEPDVSMELVFDEYYDEEERIKVCYTICLKNQLASSKSLKRTCTSWFESFNNRAWGWHSFISAADLHCAESGFIVNDTCILEVEICVQAVAQ